MLHAGGRGGDAGAHAAHRYCTAEVPRGLCAKAGTAGRPALPTKPYAKLLPSFSVGQHEAECEAQLAQNCRMDNWPSGQQAGALSKDSPA